MLNLCDAVCEKTAFPFQQDDRYDFYERERDLIPIKSNFHHDYLGPDKDMSLRVEFNQDF